MFGQYKRITNQFTGVLTGKGLEYGGSLIRTEATGYGAVYFLQNMLETQRRGPRGQDRGDLGLGQRRHPRGGEDHPARRQGADAVGLRGLHPRPRRDRPGEDRLGQGAQDQAPRPHRGVRQGVQGLDVPRRQDARGACPATWRCPARRRTSCSATTPRRWSRTAASAVVEGANMPTDLDGRARLQGRQDPLRARQGGQRRRRRGLRPGDEPELERRIRGRKRSCSSCCSTSWRASTQLRRVRRPGRRDYIDYVKGANIAGFKKVADAMLAFGVV